MTPIRITLPSPEEYQEILTTIEAIDADPNHVLPEGITAVIKNAYTWAGNKISGQIYYDSHKRFFDGYPISTAEIIEILPGGIFCTANNRYLVHIIEPNTIGGRL
jgi:hypothetical protein